MDNNPSRAPLNAQALRDALAGPGLPWRELDVVGETGSTNADLLARAAAGDDVDGAVLLAEQQTTGRGRLGRRWVTPPRGQLALSVGVAAEAVPAAGWGWLTLATGVAVADALAETAGVDAGLKWPNDVVVGPPESPGKLAGILAEVAPKRIIVIGLGLNVMMAADEVPADASATCLAALGAAVTDRNILAIAVLRQLAARIAAWRAAGGADDALVADYRRYSRILGVRVRASMPGDLKIEGVATGIDEMGRLCIDTVAGRQTVSAGDVKLLRPTG